MADEKIRYVLDIDDKGTPKLVKFGNAAEIANKKAQKALAKTAKEIDQAAHKIPLLGKTIDAFATGPMLSATTALVAFGAAFSVFEVTAEMQSLEMGLASVMHSSGLASDELLMLREAAKMPGLGYGEAIKLSTNLQAAGMSAGMARNALMAFGNALAVVGKGRTDLEGVGLALSQIMAKGKVSAEEINQIAERVPQIRVAMQAAFGTADTEILQKMGIESGQFIRAITEELGKLDQATGGLKNGADNLSDAWTDLKASFGGSGSVFQGALDEMTTMANGAARLVNKLQAYRAANVAAREQKEYEWLVARKAANGRLDDEEMKAYQIVKRHIDARAEAETKATADRLANAAKLTDGQKDLAKRSAQIQKGTLAEDLKFAETKHQLDIKDAAGLRSSLDQADALNTANIAAIKAKWAKKDAVGKAGESPAEKQAKLEKEWTEKGLAYQDKYIEETRKRHESAIAFREAAYDRQASVDEKNRADAIKVLDDENALIMNTEEDRLKYNADLEKKRALAQAQAVQDRNAAIAASFAPLQGFIQSFSASLLNGEASMAGFLDSFKQMIVGMVAELAANAAIFGVLNLVSGGAAGSFLGGLGGLSKLVLGSFAVGTRSLATTGPILAHQGEAILPRGISQAARAGDWAPAMRFMGQSSTNNATTNHINVTVHGGGNVDPNAIAQSIIRAQAKQSTRRLGGSF